MKGLSVRQRVVFWYTAMLVLIAMAVFLILRFSSAQQASAYVGEALRATLDAATDEIDLDDGEIELDDDLDDIDYANVIIYDGGGSVMLYGRIPEFDLPLQDGDIRQVEGDSGRVWHVLDTYCNLRDGGGNASVWIRAYTALDSVSSVENYSTSVFLWMIVPLAVLAGLGGYVITRRAFKPMVQITDTARSIANGDDLTQRIGLENQSDEFGQLAHTFDQMFSRLQTAFDQQQRFVSDASHELRTPLSVIRTQSEYALAQGNEEDKTQALQSIRQQAERMSGLVNQLLLLSRMDSGTQAVQKESVDLSALLESIAEELTPQARKRGIAIKTELQPGLHIYADELLLMRMIINLVDNAIRFGKKGGYIRLTLEKEDGGIIGTVEDDGAGIGEQDLPHIWERFFQANAARTAGEKENNSGLGLSIVHWIVKMHDGHISVKSSIGTGSIFTYHLPFRST
ncbi:HAMP domain-containing histidine kinase [Christensenellaceae bacterium OttesenSCG-928-K19]|nr:HAMP domain-containing histidine kinase [Christensenellaceae bacterium OttesenSCG-928-K19]